MNKSKQKYKHISFQRSWEIGEKTIYELGQCNSIIKALCNIPISPDYRLKLLSVSLKKGAKSTTAIEGNTLSVEEIEKVDKGIRLAPSKEYQETEVLNILNALNQLLREVSVNHKIEIVSVELIKRLNHMAGKDLGEHFEAIPGKIRRNNVVVGVKYRAPEYQDVEMLLKQFCEWNIKEFHFEKGQSFIDSIIQAIVSHIYIVWIHPFGDGNGRTARLLEFYIMLRSGNPDFASHLLSNFYNETRNEYYRHLDKSVKIGDLSGFISYAVRGYRDGLNDILNLVHKYLFKISWDKYIHDIFQTKKIKGKTESINKRRRNLILAIPINNKLNMDGIMNLNVEIASTYKVRSPRTLARDIKELIDLKLLNYENGIYQANTALLERYIPFERGKIKK